MKIEITDFERQCQGVIVSGQNRRHSSEDNQAMALDLYMPTADLVLVGELRVMADLTQQGKKKKNPPWTQTLAVQYCTVVLDCDCNKSAAYPTSCITVMVL